MNEFSNLGDIYNYVNKMLGKDIMGEYISPDDLTIACNVVQLDLINHYADNFEATSEVTTDTYPFLKTYGDNEFPPIYLDSYGKAPFPSDIVLPARSSYTKYLNVSCVGTSSYATVTPVTQAEFDAMMVQPMLNPIENPNENPPIMVIQNGKIMVVPNIKKVSLTGLRFPNSVYFDYDVIGGVPVYLPPGQTHTTADPLPIGTESLSAEFEWPRQVWTELANRLVKYFAVNERAEFNLQTLNPSKV